MSDLSFSLVLHPHCPQALPGKLCNAPAHPGLLNGLKGSTLKSGCEVFSVLVFGKYLFLIHYSTDFAVVATFVAADTVRCTQQGTCMVSP